MRYWIFLLFSVHSYAALEIVYHIATLNSWEETVHEQLETLERSGLGAACDRLTVTVVGAEIERVDQLFRLFSFYPKTRLIHACEDVRVCEFPGIEMARQIALEDRNAKILYLHNKGSTYTESARARHVRSWRRYLEFFLIERWQECVEALESANLCGVEWLNCTKTMAPQMETPGIFAGNFWWARADYLSTCQDAPLRPWHPPSLYRDRYYCEIFIASGKNSIPKTLHQSGVNLYEFNYTQEYYKPDPTPKQEAIEIVFLAAATPDRIPRLEKQIQLLQETGLAESSDRITFILLGPDLEPVEKLIAPFATKSRLIHANDQLYPGEFPAIEIIKRIAKGNPTAKICYLHNLATLDPPPKYKSIQHAIHQTALRRWKEFSAWVKSLFTSPEPISVISEWKRCITALESADLAGTVWKKRIPRKAHFPDVVCSGYFEDNCWWARADYLNTCHDVHYRSPYHAYREHWTSSWCKENCADGRMFIGTGDNPQVLELRK